MCCVYDTLNELPPRKNKNLVLKIIKNHTNFSHACRMIPFKKTFPYKRIHINSYISVGSRAHIILTAFHIAVLEYRYTGGNYRYYIGLFWSNNI
jgi:hypothetical protein